MHSNEQKTAATCEEENKINETNQFYRINEMQAIKEIAHVIHNG